MRGYRASVTGGSDEAAEYADRLPEVPLLIGPNRVQVVKDRLAQSPGAFDIVLLDDGFQHHRLARDLDIVLIDASRCGLDGDVLPNGWLREPARGLARADTVVVTHAADAGDGLEAVQRLITTYHGKAAEVVTSHAWARLDCYVKGQRAEGAAPNSVVAACGIGHPEAFFAQAQRMGLHLAGRESFEDHASFDAARVDRLLASARAVDGLLVTHKDWVKLRRAEAITACEIPIFVPQLELVFEQGADSLAKQLSALSGHAVRL
jgi:tetraacyldisaccharide 4'-kinase